MRTFSCQHFGFTEEPTLLADGDGEVQATCGETYRDFLSAFKNSLQFGENTAAKLP